MSRQAIATTSCERYHHKCACDECSRVRYWVASLDPSHLSSEVNKRAMLKYMKDLGVGGGGGV